MRPHRHPPIVNAQRRRWLGAGAAGLLVTAWPAATLATPAARVLVEVYHPTAVADVLHCVAPHRYAVNAVNPRDPTPHPNGPTPESMAPPDGHLRKSASAVKSTDPAPDVAAAPKPTPEPEWLRALPEGGIRRVFAHLAEHGSLSETDVAALLGAPRHLRTFALKFKEYAAKAPFDVRVDTVDNLRIYVREGTAP